MNYLLYQAYGNKDIVNEAIYSLFSFFATSTTETKVVIYTDDAQSFERYFSGRDIIYRPLTNELVQEWRGEHGFVHRVKIKILQDFFISYPDADVLYVDTDTVFISDVNGLFHAIGDNRLVMHTLEGVLKDKPNLIFKKLYKFIASNEIAVGNETIKVPLVTQMWNAGVIGMNGSRKDILNDVLAFTDNIYARFPKHIAEQFAFSYYFQNICKILPAEAEIFHYWNFKEFRQVLSRFFEENRDADNDMIMKEMGKIDPRKLIVTKLEHERSKGLFRFLRSRRH